MFFKKKKEIRDLKKDNEWLQGRIKDLKSHIEELNKSIKDLELEKYKDYDWAVLCKDYKLTVINNGKIEERVRKVIVESSYDIVPTITIEK